MPVRPLERVRYVESAKSLPFSTASFRLNDDAAASRVHAGKWRERRRPVHDGTTEARVPHLLPEQAVVVDERQPPERVDVDVLRVPVARAKHYE